MENTKKNKVTYIHLVLQDNGEVKCIYSVKGGDTHRAFMLEESTNYITDRVSMWRGELGAPAFGRFGVISLTIRYEYNSRDLHIRAMANDIYDRSIDGLEGEKCEETNFNNLPGYMLDLACEIMAEAQREEDAGQQKVA